MAATKPPIPHALSLALNLRQLGKNYEACPAGIISPSTFTTFRYIPNLLFKAFEYYFFLSRTSDSDEHE